MTATDLATGLDGKITCLYLFCIFSLYIKIKLLSFDIQFCVKVLRKIKNIVSGWVALALGDEGATDLAKERAEHCAKCVHAKHKAYLELINDEVEVVNGFVCELCSCPLSAKLRVPEEKCPDNPPKW